MKTIENIEVYKNILREQSADSNVAKAQVSSSIQQFISSASLIFAIGESSKLDTEIDFINKFLYFLTATILASIAQIYISYHLIPKAKLIGKVAIKAILVLTQLTRDYYMFLLIGLIRNQLSSEINQDLWNQLHLAPLIIIVLLYYVLTDTCNYLLNKYMLK